MSEADSELLDSHIAWLGRNGYKLNASWLTELKTLRTALPQLQVRLPRETSASIAAWQNETFGEARTDYQRACRSWERIQDAFDAVRDMDWDPSKNRPNLSRAIRAAEELAELIELLVVDDSDPKAPEECADIDIVLRGVDAAHGVERSEQVDAKMAKNRARRWRTTGDGHGQHVEEP